MKELNRIINEIKGTEKQTETELEFWREVKPQRVKNTFRGVMLILEISGENIALRYDLKNEIPLLAELIETYNIGAMDAFHAMQAHSANMDFLLTWDEKKFANRAKRVPWLKPEVMTPKDFLNTF
jgi:predicted nucleic acid-binding protein